jgi:hypothetical protein
MPADLEAALLNLVELLKPDGQMGIFYQHMLHDPGADRESLRPNSTPLGVALMKAGLAFCTRDFTEITYRHLQRKHALGRELKAAFEVEETLTLYQYIMRESESNPEPFNPAKVNFARYLYHVQL